MRRGLWTEHDPAPPQQTEAQLHSKMFAQACGGSLAKAQVDAQPPKFQLFPPLPDASVELSRLKATALSSQTLCSQATAARPISQPVECEEVGPISDREKGKTLLTEQERTRTSLGQ